MLKKISAASLSVTNIKITFCTRKVHARKKKSTGQLMGGVSTVAIGETILWLITSIVDLSFLNLCRKTLCSTNIICVSQQKSEGLSFVSSFAGFTNRANYPPYYL